MSKGFPITLLSVTLVLSLPASSLAGQTAAQPPGNTTQQANNNSAATKTEKIFINADHMQMNIESGLSVYTGNVKFSQGKLVLTGDKVTVVQRDNEVESVTVIGRPAYYNHVTETGDNIQAQSEKMVYIAGKNELVLTVNAQVKQTDHQVNSQRIIYDTLKKIVIAGEKHPTSDSPDENQRVKITLTPGNTKENKPKKASDKPPEETP
jgi:lipopolysaccharide export system protein LptA